MTYSMSPSIKVGPDADGDTVEITRRPDGRYAVRVTGADGDYRTAYVSPLDMLAIARWVEHQS